MDLAPGYHELAAPVALRPSVSCLWVAVAPPGQYRSTVVLPDACVDLIWEQGKGTYVAGPDTGPAPVISPPGTIMAGVRFAPGAGGPALRMPMSALLDQRVDVRDLGCGPAAGLARLLPESLDPGLALRTLTEVAGALTEEGPADPMAAQAARLLGRAPAQADAVADHLGLSERQLRRRCQASVGYGPATLRRILRFRRFVSWADAGRGASSPPGGTVAAPAGVSHGEIRDDRGPTGSRHLTGGGRDLAQVAFELGYADQAHLTRECVRLAGVTPAALVAARPSPPAGNPPRP
jgi:AraC-like DNA-binding protein